MLHRVSVDERLDGRTLTGSDILARELSNANPSPPDSPGGAPGGDQVARATAVTLRSRQGSETVRPKPPRARGCPPGGTPAPSAATKDLRLISRRTLRNLIIGAFFPIVAIDFVPPEVMEFIGVIIPPFKFLSGLDNSFQC